MKVDVTALQQAGLSAAQTVVWMVGLKAERTAWQRAGLKAASTVEPKVAYLAEEKAGRWDSQLVDQSAATMDVE
jgi:hypothetical protein